MRSLLVLVIFLYSAQVSAEDNYEALFAVGMQKYAEGDHDEALTYLYGAFAHKPNPTVLGLIVRTHDFMGHCSAAERQSDLLMAMFPKAVRPNPQMCAKTGEIAVSCSSQGVVLIDDGIEVQCGATIAVPVGFHLVLSDKKDGVRVQVLANQTTRIEISSPIEKLPLEYEMRLKPTKIAAQGSAKPGFRIWVRTHLRDDPDLNVKGQLPGFEIYQGRDGLFHIFSDSLKPVHSKKSGWGSGGSSDD